MSNTVQMPALGESVTEGTVTRWLKEVGEHVDVDEPLLEVSTDKVDTEIPSPYAGVVEKILADEDDEVEIGGDLAVIGDGTGASEAPAAAAPQAAEPEPEPTPEPEPAPAAAESAAPTASGDSGDSETVVMPALGESVTEGTVTRWLKEVGEHVDVDEPLLEVSTDKVDTEIPSPVAGTVLQHLAEEDDEVEVGGALALVGSGAPAAAPAAPAPEPEPEPAPAPAPEPEPAPQAAAEPTPAPEPAPAPAAAPAPSIAQTVASSDVSAYVTPLVRKLAKEKGVDLSTVSGTGVGGRIRKQDVLAVAQAAQSVAGAPAAAPVATGAPRAPFQLEIPEEAKKLRGTTQKASRIRQTIAKRMRESLQTTAQLTQVTEVDMTKVSKLRAAHKAQFQAKHGVKLTYLPFFAKAVAEALQIHPAVNAQYDVASKQITYFDHEDIGFAVDTPRGLVVPIVKNAGGLSVAEIAKAIDDVASRTRDNKIGPDELTGGTFTITNIGSFGAQFDTPIINSPQVGILGTGTITKRPVAVKGADGEYTIALRDMVYLPLTYNHELVDGADAGRFLKTVKDRLEDGNFEADLDL
ncbi:2-oxoglutarate dehydrogenase, E2 component, dihydrolipoamide succinyltransferase [Brevibacterium moorei]|uniref:2-oxoglutarate dehydrogenase, E2 component, dihydrolipoamide succinyltransferase n=1 Tax=Brevibacterium moorei TaxID=2968457 RepID=UPI00211B8A2F|nr:2-oxoglutarate dehydrogenase, E2 component, dihydrolipoamide succinyltransferase [Brevibacterium sp. 68QC2CO]MCQ9384346.1 2-oxoglutarate dehydrogenase, E2 component, dihydrolipoamide succinyltransferase [Brevibacterium sp. 68QC2CO]